jgi:MinD-like ATPase involved in chromosome partitioning or flagellar assembly
MTAGGPIDYIYLCALPASMNVTLFYSGKGGVGKSTLAANTAYVLSTRYQTLAMDFSGADRTLSALLSPGCPNEDGIYDVLFAFPEVRGRMKLTVCGGELPGLQVAPPGNMEAPVLKLDFYVVAQRIDLLMNALTRRYPFIVADYPGKQIQFDPVLQALMRHVDHLILVTQPTQSSLNELKYAFDFVLRHYKPPPVISIATNMWTGERTYEEGLRTPGGFHIRVKADPVVFSLGRVPKLQYKCAECKEFRRAVEQIADGIVQARLTRRHQVATFFP